MIVIRRKKNAWEKNYVNEACALMVQCIYFIYVFPTDERKKKRTKLIKQI